MLGDPMVTAQHHRHTNSSTPSRAMYAIMVVEGGYVGKKREEETTLSAQTTDGTSFFRSRARNALEGG